MDARAELGLGTAAIVNTGVANGNVPAMDATGYPAADGSRITNVAPRGWIDGLTLSNNATDAAKDIDIAAGVARDDGDAAGMTLSATLVKQIDASWAVGTNQGGLDGTESVAGTPDADTWYHVWLIRRSDTGVVDALFSESATAPTMPANYDRKRRIGAVLTDGTANIIGFSQNGDEFLWDDPPLDLDGTTATTGTLEVLSVPTGVVVYAEFIVRLFGNNPLVYISSPDVNDEAPSSTAAPLLSVSSVTSKSGTQSLNIRTNTSAQIRRRSSLAGQSIKIATLGWDDPRGRNA